LPVDGVLVADGDENVRVSGSDELGRDLEQVVRGDAKDFGGDCGVIEFAESDGWCSEPEHGAGAGVDTDGDRADLLFEDEPGAVARE
jgi:hypothetical protein